MIRWTSPQGERLTLRPCYARDGRTVMEVLDGKKLLSVADLETGGDLDVSILRTRIATTPTIVEKLKGWGGRVEERAA